MLTEKNETNIRCVGKRKSQLSDNQQVSAAAQRLAKSFEGRQLLQAAAQLEADDLKALANFATSASRGMW